jgi:hypothetical protein
MFAFPWRRVDRRYSGPVVVQATHIKLRRVRDMPRFVLVSMQVRRAVLRSDGAIGVALYARPWLLQFLSVSTWQNEEHALAFVRSPAHRRAMELFGTAAREPGLFPRWSAHTDAGHPRWGEVFRRVARAHQPAAGSEPIAA